MLGDTAVAVHPEDERYKDLVGKHADPAAGRPPHPDRGRRIRRSRRPAPARSRSRRRTISTTSRSAAAQAGDDQHLRRRRAASTTNAPEAYRGLDRFEAREKVVADLEARWACREDRRPHADAAARRPLRRGDRAVADRPVVSATPRPWPSRRSRRSRRAARVFVPKQWENTYFEWMRNIQPWCISRQLWWGHQIPAWYGAGRQGLRRR